MGDREREERPVRPAVGLRGRTPAAALEVLLVGGLGAELPLLGRREPARSLQRAQRRLGDQRMTPDVGVAVVDEPALLSRQPGRGRRVEQRFYFAKSLIPF